jgi:hypothetical protein
VRRKAARPYVVMGPDIHGPVLYGRFRSLRTARRFTSGMERYWTIAKILHAGADLLKEHPEGRAGVVEER